MVRRRLVVLTVVVVAAGGIVGYGIWRGSGDECADTVREADPSNLPRVAAPQELAATVLDTIEEENGRPVSDPSTINEGAAIALAPSPFGTPRVTMIDPDVEFIGDHRLLDSGDPVTVTDSRTGELIWARERPGFDSGAIAVGDRVVIPWTDDSLTVATINMADGDLLGCARTDDSAVAAEGAGAAARVDQDGLALVFPAPEHGVGLTTVDVRGSRIELQRMVDLDFAPSAVDVAGGHVITTRVSHDPLDAWTTSTLDVERRRGERWDLRALSLADGDLAWDYAFDDGGGRPYVHQVVGVTDPLVLVHATRHDKRAGIIENELVAVDATTGTAQWSDHLPSQIDGYYTEARLLGDVVLTKEADENDPNRVGAWLAGYDAATGDRLWRIPSTVPDLDGAAIVGDEAVLAGGTFAGLTLVDLRTGRSRTAFDGISISSIDVDDTAVGVEYYLGSTKVLMIYDR